jgi:hypothetical protein
MPWRRIQCLTKYHAVGMYWWMEVQLYKFLTWALDGGELSDSRPSRFIPGGQTPVLLIRRLAGPQSRSGAVMTRKHSFPVPSWNRTQVVQPVAQSNFPNEIIKMFFVGVRMRGRWENFRGNEYKVIFRSWFSHWRHLSSEVIAISWA